MLKEKDFFLAWDSQHNYCESTKIHSLVFQDFNGFSSGEYYYNNHFHSAWDLMSKVVSM